MGSGVGAASVPHYEGGRTVGEAHTVNYKVMIIRWGSAAV